MMHASNCHPCIADGPGFAVGDSVTSHTNCHSHTHTHTHTRTSSSGVADSIQGVLDRHQKMQDEIAEDMIRMARSLRDNSLIAKDIIIGDNKVGEDRGKS